MSPLAFLETLTSVIRVYAEDCRGTGDVSESAEPPRSNEYRQNNLFGNRLTLVQGQKGPDGNPALNGSSP